MSLHTLLCRIIVSSFPPIQTRGDCHLFPFAQTRSEVLEITDAPPEDAILLLSPQTKQRLSQEKLKRRRVTNHISANSLVKNIDFCKICGEGFGSTALEGSPIVD